jgi:hypothetical protein
MDGGAHFLQISKTHYVVSVKRSYLQMIDPTSDFPAAQVLNLQMPISTGSVQTDKRHATQIVFESDVAYTLM